MSTQGGPRCERAIALGVALALNLTFIAVALLSRSAIAAAMLVTAVQPDLGAGSLVQPRAIAADWNLARSRLPLDVRDNPDVFAAIERYEEGIAALIAEVQRQSAAAPLPEAASALAAGDRENAGAVVEAWLNLLRTRIWPAADRLLEQAWVEICAVAPTADAECGLARREMRRAVIGRAFDSGVDLIDLRQRMIGSREPDGAVIEGQDLRGRVAIRGSAPVVLVTDDMASSIDEHLDRWANLVDVELGGGVEAQRRLSASILAFARAPAPAEGNAAPPDTSRLVRQRGEAWAGKRSLDRSAALAVAGKLDDGIGPEAREVWLAAWEHVVAVHVFDVAESPDLAIRWIREAAIADTVRDECERVYLEYLDARRPLRDASRDAYLSLRGRVAMRALLFEGGAERKPLDQLAEQRRELATRTVELLNDLLGEVDAERLARHIRRVHRTAAEPAFPWRGM